MSTAKRFSRDDAERSHLFSFSASALAFTRFAVAAVNFRLSGGPSNEKRYLRVAAVAVGVAAVGVDRSLSNLTRHKGVGQLYVCRSKAWHSQ